MSILTNNIITANYNVRLFMASFLLAFSSGNHSFDQQAFGVTQAMDSFVEKFGERDAKGHYALPANFLSYSNAFPSLCSMIGIALGSTISERFGRRLPIFLMSLWSMCMVPILVTSQSRWQFLAGRMLNSVYTGMEISTIPVFQSEIVPREVRGLAVASFQLSFGIGQLIMSLVCNKTAGLASNWAWKIPYLCFLIVPSIVASSIWFQPESPRWLVRQGRIDDARKALIKLRKDSYDVEYELNQIVLTLEVERSASKPTYAACFRGTNRRRTFIVLVVNFFLSSTGNSFVSQYGTIVIKTLNSLDPFVYQIVQSTLNIVLLLLNDFWNDKIGRRPIMLTGAFLQTLFMFIVAGLGLHENESKTINSAIVAFVMLFSLVLGSFWAPLSYLISAEIPNLTLRDKTSQMGYVTTSLTQFVISYILPYLLNAPYANLGMKVGFIFGPISLISLIWGYIYLPECKELSLEQIDFLFQNHIPARKSRRWVLDHFQDALARDVEGNILEKEGVAGITTEEVKTAEDRDDLQGRHSVPTFA